MIYIHDTIHDTSNSTLRDTINDKKTPKKVKKSAKRAIKILHSGVYDDEYVRKYKGKPKKRAVNLCDSWRLVGLCYKTKPQEIVWEAVLNHDDYERWLEK